MNERMNEPSVENMHQSYNNTISVDSAMSIVAQNNIVRTTCGVRQEKRHSEIKEKEALLKWPFFKKKESEDHYFPCHSNEFWLALPREMRSRNSTFLS